MNQKLHEYLRAKRISLGFTQADLAEKLGYASPQIISNYERGECGIPGKKARQLCKILKIPLETYMEEHFKIQKKKILRGIK